MIATFIPLVVFCAVTLFTPGPNNVMLMTSGLNFGLRRSLSHAFGVALGFPFLVLCVGLGLGVVFTQYPLLYVLVKYAGAAYLLYLAWCIAISPPPDTKADALADTQHKPMGFMAAVAFQWINPKAIVMAVGGVSTYATLLPYPYNALLIAMVFGIIGILSSLTWAGLGTALQRLLHRPRLIRSFNVAMGFLLALSLYPVAKDLLTTLH